MIPTPVGLRQNIYRVRVKPLQVFGQTSTGFGQNICRSSAGHLKALGYKVLEFRLQGTECGQAEGGGSTDEAGELAAFVMRFGGGAGGELAKRVCHVVRQNTHGLHSFLVFFHFSLCPSVGDVPVL